ncbi:hypothetical protein TREMEDRAFT_35119 [Tremella mesenterica DSM 1558]|uniref:uncharacterized protein n=1 Tax=Tremella mesenterica (strain ATCC 24925 / CBS 8224 / DSM 1558 / NBRC 9311 / NRRL Y-6157 / RJB 2259-6 / UBC 559-6) TaxID=578456 RepID=UPI00032BD48D|nr:uncharacterized protein TREMEDRAFT_35119 [Tremella mesenterica DSM 1558]EIW66263.1 hypothetical protein TREMEDRAFT_35119 [Tremella mesenterica DSM 1558]
MRLDATDLRYITNDEFKVLTAVEVGSRDHEVVPTSSIAEISGLRGGNVNKALSDLAKRNLVARVQGAKYEGFRLTYGGLDYLALRTFSRRKPPSVYAVGQKIGVGKESDIHVVVDESDHRRVLKMHRLGRISFRQVKSKRDYLGNRTSASWMQLSRLAAQKEFAFMKVLHANDFPVPVPIDQVRHCIVMSLIDGYPLRQIQAVESPSDLYAKLMELIVRLANHGLIHGDFNEFNIIVKKDGEPVVIDFPQMVSTRHRNAEYFFNRDVNCIRRYFRRRYKYEGLSWPTWADVLANQDDTSTSFEQVGPEGASEPTQGEVQGSANNTTGLASTSRGNNKRLDLEVEASGFGGTLARELEDHMIRMMDVPEQDNSDDDEDSDFEEEEDEEEEEVVEIDEDQKEEDTTFDEDHFQRQLAIKLERMRLNKALGNDVNEELYTNLGGQMEEQVRDVGSEGNEGESDEENSIAISDETPVSEYPTGTRKRDAQHRINLKTSSRDEVQAAIRAEVGKHRSKEERKHHSRKAPVKAGNVKGHKWKQSTGHLVEKNGGW